METLHTSAETAPVTHGRFALYQAVRVILHAEVTGDDLSKAWTAVEDFGTGMVMLPPDETDVYADCVTIMPDEPKPVGSRFASIHPITFHEDPFMHTFADGSKSMLRYVIESV